LVGIAERARLLGGLAAVESEPGRGTLIRVYLPTQMEASDRIAG
jgi:signal transduction histidine kinase